MTALVLTTDEHFSLKTQTREVCGIRLCVGGLELLPRGAFKVTVFLRNWRGLRTCWLIGLHVYSWYLCPPLVFNEALLVQKQVKMWDKLTCHSLNLSVSTVELSTVTCPSNSTTKYKAALIGSLYSTLHFHKSAQVLIQENWFNWIIYCIYDVVIAIFLHIFCMYTQTSEYIN